MEESKEIATNLQGPDAPKFDMEALGIAIGQAVAAGINATQRQKVNFGAYDPRRFGQAPGDHKRLKFRPTINYTQNGNPCNIETLSAEEVKLLNQVHRPGKYLGGTFEVIVREEGPDVTTINIRNDVSSKDKLIEGSRIGGTFLQLLQKIVAEQDAAEKSDEEWLLTAKERRSKEFFASKSTREARERANASQG